MRDGDCAIRLVEIDSTGKACGEEELGETKRITGRKS